MPDKHYKTRIEERNGDMEFGDDFILSFDPELISEHRACMTISKQWRSGSWNSYDPSEDGFWSDNTLIFPAELREEIPAKELKLARKYIQQMYIEDEPDDDGESYSDYFDEEGNYIRDED
jgi:hypothetical protein